MLQLRTPGSSRIVLTGTLRDVLEGKEQTFLIICKDKIKGHLFAYLSRKRTFEISLFPFSLFSCHAQGELAFPVL